MPCLFSPLKEPQDGGIIGVFDDDVAVLGGDTVVRVQGEVFGPKTEVYVIWKAVSVESQ